MELSSILDKALDSIKKCKNKNQLNDVKVLYLGKKGILTSLMKELKTLPKDKKPAFGKAINEIKLKITNALSEKLKILETEAYDTSLITEKIDVTIPGTAATLGHKHIITQTLHEIFDIFISMGYEIKDGPEIEDVFYNFEALNMPDTHPARDMQDSFYITNTKLLRSQTSPIQIRTMLSQKPPLRIIGPGRVYRRDYDVSHLPMFTQVEVLYVDRTSSVAQLKGTLQQFTQAFFGDDVQIRLRPSYFPFTEPSFEVDISCIFCGGEGCPVCKGTGWVEVLGSGMVHPNVFKSVGYAPGEYKGFAIGMGVERLAMLKYGINDIRHFYKNDVRFLKQF